MSEPVRGTIFFRLIRGLLRLGMKVYLRFESHGSENVPEEGPCIVASNHASFLDPPAVGCGMRHRIVHFLARDTLFPFGRWLFKALQTVPIDRTRGDIAALRRGIDVLKNGRVLGLFPEGTRTLTGELQPPKGGIGFLIAKANVPVVPAYVDGSYVAYPKKAKWIKPHKVRVFYGSPIMPNELAALGSGREVYEKVGALVMSRIAELRPDS